MLTLLLTLVVCGALLFRVPIELKELASIGDMDKAIARAKEMGLIAWTAGRDDGYFELSYNVERGFIKYQLNTISVGSDKWILDEEKTTLTYRIGRRPIYTRKLRVPLSPDENYPPPPSEQTIFLGPEE